MCIYDVVLYVYALVYIVLKVLYVCIYIYVCVCICMCIRIIGTEVCCPGGFISAIAFSQCKAALKLTASEKSLKAWHATSTALGLEST